MQAFSFAVAVTRKPAQRSCLYQQLFRDCHAVVSLLRLIECVRKDALERGG